MSQKGFPFAPNVAAPGLSDASSSSSGGRKAKKRKGHPTYVVGDDTPKKSSIGAGIPSHDENESLGITSSQQAASAPLDSIVPSDEVLDGFMSIVRGTQGSRAVLVVISQTCTRFISGFCRVTLLHGSASIHGYTLATGQRVENVSNPSWLPAVRMHATGRVRKTGSCTARTSSGSSAVAAGLKKLNKTSLFPTLHVEPGRPNVAANMLDASECVVLLEGVPDAELSWLMRAENLRTFCDESSSSSSSSALESEHPGNCSVVLPGALTCVSVDTAIIGDAHAVANRGIDCTRLPPTWVSASEKLMSLMSLSKQSKQSKQMLGESVNSLDSPRVLVCGAKGVGKSTCMRFMLNRLLSKNKAVCVLDIDVGQPEYGVPGTVSLTLVSSPNLSSPHLHMQQPLESYYFGEVTAKGDSERLNTSVSLLLQKYERVRDQLASGNLQALDIVKGVTLPAHRPAHASNIFDSLDTSSNDGIKLPLVVNTDGFIRYMGSEILQAAVQAVAPHMVLQVVSDKDRYIPALSCIDSEIIHPLESGSSSPSSVAALDLRNLRMVSYFLRDSVLLKDLLRLESDSDDQLRIHIRNGTIVDKGGLLCAAFCGQVPFVASMPDTSLGCLSDAVATQLLPAVINASIVGVCLSGAHTQKSITLEDSEGSTIKFRQELRDSRGHIGMSPCVGLAVVRSIDVKKSQLHILCPEALNVTAAHMLLENPATSIALIRGSMALPLLLMFSPSMPCHPYMTNDSAGDGSLQTKARNNVKRRVYNNQNYTS